MSTGGGGWQMCYTTNKDVRISTDLFSSTAYGVNGYRSDCRYSAFTDIITINHDTKQAAWFTRNGGVATTPFFTVTTWGVWYTNAGLFGVFTGFGVAASSQYQLLVCDSGAYYSGLFMSGATGGKSCDNLAMDTSSKYFRTEDSISQGIAWNANGFYVRFVRAFLYLCIFLIQLF